MHSARMSMVRCADPGSPKIEHRPVGKTMFLVEPQNYDGGGAGVRNAFGSQSANYAEGDLTRLVLDVAGMRECHHARRAPRECVGFRV